MLIEGKIDGQDSKKSKKTEAFSSEFKIQKNWKMQNMEFSRDSCESCPVTSESYQFGSLILQTTVDAVFTFSQPEHAPGDRPSKLLLEKLPGCCSS